MFDQVVSVAGSALMVAVAWTYARIDALSRKVDVAEARYEDLKALLNARFDAVDKRFDDMGARIARVEGKINGGNRP